MKSKVQQPKLGSITLGTLQDGDPDLLVPRTELHSARFSDLILDELELANAHLDGVHFDGLSADRAALAGTSLTEAVLARVNIPVLDAHGHAGPTLKSAAASVPSPHTNRRSAASTSSGASSVS